MAGQPRDVDFYDTLQRKFVEELPDELFERDPSTRGGIPIDGPEVSDVQHETAGHGRGHEPEKIRNRYRTGGKVCERRHLQEKERCSSVCPPTLTIHRLLNRRDIVSHNLGTQRRIQWRDIRAERVACHLLHRTFMIQPETLQAIELRDDLVDITLKERRRLDVRLSDPQAFAVIRERDIRHRLPNLCECGRRRLEDFEIARLESLLPEPVYQLEEIGSIDVDGQPHALHRDFPEATLKVLENEIGINHQSPLVLLEQLA